MTGKTKIALMALIVALFLSGIFLIHTWEKSGAQVQSAGEVLTSSPTEEQTYYNDKWFTSKKGLETVLLIGVDKSAVNEEITGHGEFEQSDFIMLLVMDKTQEHCTALHINRDTIADVSVYTTDTHRLLGTEYEQLAFAHAYRGGKEGCQDTADAVSRLLYGTKIDHYISLYFDGIPVLNDMVGGVTVKVPADLAAIDESFTEGETITLHGEQALAYVRRRDTGNDNSNALRMGRHRLFLEALQSKLAERAAADDDFAMSALLELNDYMVSDCTIEQLASISNQLSAYGAIDYRTPEGENKLEGQYIAFYPEETALRETVMELFYDQVKES